MLRIVVDQDKTIAIPTVVEHAGDTAVNEYVRLHTGVDLAERRRRQLAELEARTQVAAVDVQAEGAVVTAEDPHVKAALEAAVAAGLAIAPATLRADLAEAAPSPDPAPAAPRPREPRRAR